MSEIRDNFFSFQRGDPLVFFRFGKSQYTGSDWLWRTEMEGQTSLTVEIVLPRDVWISKILSGHKFLMVAWLFTELYGWKVTRVRKTPLQVTMSFQSPGGIRLITYFENNPPAILRTYSNWFFNENSKPYANSRPYCNLES